MTGRSGAALVETVVAAAAGAILLHLVLSGLVAQRAAVEGLRRGGEALAAVRVARHLLAADLRAWSDDHAAAEVGPDSLALRVVRGLAAGCPGSAPSADGSVLVRAAGVRAPDPAKDSVLVLTPDGRTRVAALVGSEPADGAPCAPGPGRVYRWTVAPGGGVPVLARYFERGSYHLNDGALRYRRGRSGRQPLTPEVVTAASAFRAPGAVALVVASDTTPWRVHPGW